MHRNVRIFLLFVAISLFLTAQSEAAFRVTVTKADGFASAKLEKVAIVTVDCDGSVDCSAIERKAQEETLERGVEFKIVSGSLVRQLLLDKGHTSYSVELREWLATELELDALMELKVPFAAKGDGYGGRRGSEAKVELVLVKPSGSILLHGVGTGRPLNVVTSPERVAGNIVGKIIQKAFD